MRKLSIFVALILVLLVSIIAVTATPVMADGGRHRTSGWNVGNTEPGNLNLGCSHIGTVNLYQKDPAADFAIVPDGGWGTLFYNVEGLRFNILFTGHSLQKNTNYSLIYYADAASGPNSLPIPGILIASGRTNRGGNIVLAASLSLQHDLPMAADANSQPDANGNIYGAKIFLVPSSDYDASTNLITGWNMNQWMFPLNGIFYTYTSW
jgi:hypothetical protein